jgi:cytochrome c-type biogenesis protein CcmH/NrfG
MKAFSLFVWSTLVISDNSQQITRSCYRKIGKKWIVTGAVVAVCLVIACIYFGLLNYSSILAPDSDQRTPESSELQMHTQAHTRWGK